MLVECVAAFRKTRHPRWAALAELASGPERPLVGAGKKNADLAAWQALEQRADPMDLPRLVKALEKMTSPRAAELLPRLTHWQDPRLVTLLLKFLGAPPWRAGTALGFFRVAAKVLAETQDARARDGLAELGGRYKTVIDTNMGDVVGALLRRTAAEMKVIEPKALSPKDEARCAELELQFPAELKAAAHRVAAKKGHARDEATLLEAVWAEPADDAPRLVYADALQQRSDPRGELIVLQVQRAKGASTPESRTRERELLCDSKRYTQWTAPLSQVGDCFVERGFPAKVQLRARGAGDVADHKAWATVHTLTELQVVAQKTARALLESCGALRDIATISPKLVDAAAGLPVRGVTFDHVPDPDVLARFTHLERLDIAHLMQPSAVSAAHLSAMPKLKRLSLWHQMSAAPRAFAAVPGLVELKYKGTALEPEALQPLRSLQRLELKYDPAARELQGLPLHTLTVGSCEPRVLEPLIEALPTLRVVSGFMRQAPDNLGPMLELLRNSALERIEAGSYRWVKGPEGLGVEPTGWTGELGKLLGALPGRPVRFVRLRPLRALPDAPTSPLPTQDRLGSWHAELDPLGVRIDVAWD